MKFIVLFLAVICIAGCAASRTDKKKMATIRVQLPGKKLSRQVEITVRKSGLYYKDKEIDDSRLQMILKKEIVDKKTVVLVIRSDKDVVYGRMVAIMDIARKAGV